MQQQLSTKTSMQSSPRHDGVALMTTLPDEILLQIFSKYHDRTRSLLVLRLTCRSWSNLLSSAISLSRRIYLCDTCTCGGYGVRPAAKVVTHKVDYCCRSTLHLRRALELVGDAHFELSICTPIIPSTDDIWDSVPWQRFQTQCIGLTIHCFMSREDDVVPLVNRLPSLRSLRSLSLHDKGMITSSILRRIDPNAHSLRTMKVWNADGSMFDEPHRIASILGDLQSFHSDFQYRGEPTGDSEFAKSLPTTFSISLLSSFRNLKDLTWDGPSYTPEKVRALLQGVVHWRFTLDRLETCYSLLAGFPSDPVLYQLRELVIRTNEQDRNHKQIGMQLILPRLTELALIGSWTGLAHIDAPNLEELSLHATSDDPLSLLIDEIGGLLGTSMRPKNLSIHEDGSGSILMPFLRGPFADVSGLDIYSRAGWEGGSSLERCLVEEVFSSDAMWPNLRRLTVYEPFYSKRLSNAYLKEIESRLNTTINRVSTRLVDVRSSLPPDLRW